MNRSTEVIASINNLHRLGRAHVRRPQKGRHKTYCGLLIGKPREAFVNASGVHRFKKPRVVQEDTFSSMRWPEQCGRCARSCSTLFKI